MSKRIQILSLISLVFMLLPVTFHADSNIEISFNGFLFIPRDEVFREVHSSGIFYPEFECKVPVFDRISLFGTVGWFESEGAEPDGIYPIYAKQRWISAGVGWKDRLIGDIDYLLEAAFAFYHWEVKSGGLIMSDNAYGPRFGAGVNYDLNQWIMLKMKAVYLFNNLHFVGETDVLGGFLLGGGVGISL